MIKYCVVCGAVFQSPPSSKKVTCSPECRSIRAARAARGRKRVWSQSARDRRSSDPSVLEQMKRLQPLGAAAASDIPEGQRGPQNRESKVWELVDPDGNTVVVTNLLDWARNNYTIFEPPSADPEQAAMRISSGFKAIASSIRGVKSRKRRVSTYKGWGLRSLPISKEERINDDRSV